jgi:hypothetical protein
MANRLPSSEIPDNLRSESYVLDGVLKWFDEIWIDAVFPVIDNLYNLCDYRRIDDGLLDNLLYDKGISTSRALTADMKRCILSKWIDIYRLRHTPAGFKLYFECMLPGLEIDFIGGRTSNFFTFNSTKFSYANEEMINTASNPTYENLPNLMTYLYHPSYQVNVYLGLFYDSADQDLLLYINDLIQLEVPVIGQGVKLNHYFLHSGTSDTVSVSGATVTVDVSVEDFTLVQGFTHIGIDQHLYAISNIDTSTSLTLEVGSWREQDMYYIGDRVLGSDGKLYRCVEQHVSTTVFADDVTEGYWSLVEGVASWNIPDKQYYNL